MHKNDGDRMKLTAPKLRPCALAIASAAVLLAGCGSSSDDDNSATLIPEIKVLSTRADMVTDGDALVEIAVPAGADASGLTVSVDGRDVTSAFTTRDGRTLGLVNGLKVGSNVLTARTNGTRPAKLTITNASRGGPIFSGNPPATFFCATPTPVGASGVQPATNASGLTTAATDAKCNIATETRL